MNNVGLQLWSIREEAEKDLLGMIEEAAEMGYKGVQFAGFFDHTAEEVKAKMDAVGIKATGAHVQIEQLENSFEETLKYHEIIGNDLIIIPFLQENMRTSQEDYERTAERMDEIGRKAYAAGFTLAYHNHDFEFDVFDGKTGFEILFENTDEDHLKMELDCFWAAYTNNDPLEIIEKYAGRVVSLHIKDMEIVDNTPISTELGTGTLPLAKFIQKGQAHNVKQFIVEQEHFTGDPVESAAQNAKTMSAMFDN